MTVKRQIIRIDEELCDGCEQCIPACPEGALQIVGGVAKLVKEGYCDGLGACLGDCPQGALTVEEREVEEYDEKGVITHLTQSAPERIEEHMRHLREHGMSTDEGGPAARGASVGEAPAPPGAGCPSARLMQWKGPGDGGETAASGSGDFAGRGGAAAAETAGEPLSSELRQWPIQLHLVSPLAPYFKDADLVLVADCVPFAYANFHEDFLKGKAVAIACPKLDDTRPYVRKLSQMVDSSDLKSIKVIVMEVPCCSGLVGIARDAVRQAERSIPIEYVIIGVKGGVQGSGC